MDLNTVLVVVMALVGWAVIVRAVAGALIGLWFRWYENKRARSSCGVGWGTETSYGRIHDAFDPLIFPKAETEVAALFPRGMDRDPVYVRIEKGVSAFLVFAQEGIEIIIERTDELIPLGDGVAVVFRQMTDRKD